MILIFSHEHLDEPTNMVIDWLSFYEAEFLRINGDDFSNNIRFKIDFKKREIRSKTNRIDNKSINVVWFRRWKNPYNQTTFFDKFKEEKFSSEDVLLIEKFHKFLNHEEQKMANACFSIFNKVLWIPKPEKAKGSVNKLEILLMAESNGLKVPNTIITNGKKDVIEFFKKNKSIITKPISEATTMIYKGILVPMFTKIVSRSEANLFPNTFFPSLFQENIRKQFEVRTFIHRDKIYSMAIFSQRDTKTNTDFRNYNEEKPNRYIPFLLPKDIEQNLFNLLKDLDLVTGSVDLICDVNNNYYFLEINPVGQFGMVSLNCNYNIEKMIAEDLITINSNK